MKTHHLQNRVYGNHPPVSITNPTSHRAMREAAHQEGFSERVMRSLALRRAPYAFTNPPHAGCSIYR